MTRRLPHLAMLGLVCALAVVAGVRPASAQTPKAGGVLNLRLREDLPYGFSIHESPTISTLWPAMPCFSNLVLFDPAKRTHSSEAIVGELAERWSWQDNYRALVFFLRDGVKWHDGTPFTAKDVKATLDMLREAPEAPAKLRLNPRRDWYTNVQDVEAPNARTVIIRLKRPQPSILTMLASGFTPIMPAHVPPSAYRTGCIGTGPFKLKEWRRGEFVEYVKNADYFIKGRPYLDGLRYSLIADRGTATSALQVGRVDVAFPGETPKPIAERLKAAVPQMVITPANASVVEHIILNVQRPPFDNVKVREAVSRAVDRRAWSEALYQGGAVFGAALLPKPYGLWGLAEKDLRALPGGGSASDEKSAARRLLTEAGFSDRAPLRLRMLTRALPAFVDVASFVVSELKRVGIDAELATMDTVQFEAAKVRGEFTIATDRTGVEPDDPDAVLNELYGCGSPRNYSHYCDETIARMIERQSQELDPAKRMAMVHDIQRRLAVSSASPVLGWRMDYFAQWPYVKNLVPHHSIYSWGRLQDVWLDK